MNSQQNTLSTIRNILSSANNGASGNDGNTLYNNAGNIYGNGVVSPPLLNPQQGPIGRPESPLNEEDLGMQIQRATSAPPVLDNILFASQSRYSHLFGDIRCDQNYESFYRAHNNPSKLPQPLDNDVFLMSWLQGGNEDNTHRAVQPPTHHQSLSLQHDQSLLHKLNGISISQPSLNDSNSTWGFTNNLDQQQHFGQNQFVTPPQQQQYQNMQLIRPQPIQGAKQAIQQPSSSSFYSNIPTAAPASIPTVQPSYSSVLQQVIKPQPVIPSQPTSTVSSQRSSPHHSQPQSRQSPNQSDSDSEDESDGATPSREVSPAKDKDGKRLNVSKFNTVQDALGKIYKLSKDQYGCRFLQKKLEDGDKQDLQMIFDEVYDHVVELMTDPFGNYLCQKLVEYCNDTQKMSLIRAVSTDIVSINMNMHGTRAVQKLIECLANPQHIQAVIAALHPFVVNLIKDLNGNHVIQRCLQKLSTQDKQFIYDTVACKCIEVATHKHGCCVLQRCIDYASVEQKFMLVKEIASNALYLVQNPFGNYVVQYVLDLNEVQLNDMVISKFLGHISTLSTNKFSSNVMEKCLRIGSPHIKSAMVNEVMVLENLPQVLQDSYGNYVIQTAITVSDPKQFQQFNEVIRPLLHLVRNTPYGKKIESKLNKKPSQQSAPASSSSTVMNSTVAPGGAGMNQNSNSGGGNVQRTGGGRGRGYQNPKR